MTFHNYVIADETRPSTPNENVNAPVHTSCLTMGGGKLSQWRKIIQAEKNAIMNLISCANVTQHQLFN